MDILTVPLFQGLLMLVHMLTQLLGQPDNLPNVGSPGLGLVPTELGPVPRQVTLPFSFSASGIAEGMK